jgi:hypothetical protein
MSLRSRRVVGENGKPARVLPCSSKPLRKLPILYVAGVAIPKRPRAVSGGGALIKWPVMMAGRPKDIGFLFLRHFPERSARTMIKRPMVMVRHFRMRSMVVLVRHSLARMRPVVVMVWRVLWGRPLVMLYIIARGVHAAERFLLRHFERGE